MNPRQRRLKVFFLVSRYCFGTFLIVTGIMKPIVSILIQLSWQTGPQMEILRGIREYMRLKPNWTLCSNTWPDALKVQGQSAIILTKWSHLDPVARPRFKGPIVSMVDCGYADVIIERDNIAIGICAAKHFLELGFKHLAYILPNNIDATEEFLEQRWQGFRKTAQAMGASAHKAPMLQEGSRRSLSISWLESLPKPCGVFCANDYTAMEILALARAGGILVPEDMAVLGVDNMDIWCETSIPPLSSINIPWRKVGYTTAHWVDLLLQGQRPPSNRRILIQDSGVVVRQSTDIIAIENPKLSKLLHIIRTHACEGLTVKELLSMVPGDRRQFYRLFEQELGRTPHDEIRRVQIAKARQLLTHTDLTLPQVSKAVGLSEIYFINNFRKATGLTPGAFRRQHRSDLGITSRVHPALQA